MGAGFVHVPTSGLGGAVAGAGGVTTLAGVGDPGCGAGLGPRNMKYATMPSANIAAATMPRTSGTLEGRLERAFAVGAVGGGNCTATVACTGVVSDGAVEAT